MNYHIRAHCYSLLEIALKFEQFRQTYPHNKNPTWFLKAAEDLFVFTDQLQGVINMPVADRRSKKIIRNFTSRIS